MVLLKLINHWLGAVVDVVIPWSVVGTFMGPMNFTEAKNYILQRLESELAPDLYFHGMHHTLDVGQSVAQLARNERVEGEALTLLLTAAYYHDAGFLEQYQNNEPIAVRIAGEVLPRFGYSAEAIQTIGGIILATRIPQSPRTHLEELMCDADLDYLGRDDFYPIANSLRRELIQYGLVTSERQWNEIQTRFLTQHAYFTQTARATRERRKQKHLEEIRQLLAQ